MSFAIRKDVIELGDTVMLYLGINKIHALQVVSQIKNKHGNLIENIFQTTYGALKVESLVGKKYGTKVNLSKGWAYVIYPTPELWTITLPHRTQILYFHDISLIIHQLEIKPGSIVVESGTGSGSLSHALIRNVKPSGFLHTFDFHAHRVAVAKTEFESHGLGEYVAIEERDVIRDGFGAPLNGKADAVFLDLPKPWEVIPHVVAATKESGGRFVSFSPCIEQVQKTTEALVQLGFTDVATTECLLKELQVLNKNLPILDLDFTKSAKDPSTENGAAKKFKAPGSGDSRELSSILTALPAPTVPGHTGYLTSATLPPVWARRQPKRRTNVSTIDTVDEDVTLSTLTA